MTVIYFPRAKSARRSPLLTPLSGMTALAMLAIFAVAGPKAVERWAPPPSAALASSFSGAPSAVTDGDTLRLGAMRVRLKGIDAPEMPTPEGLKARAHLARLIGGGQVACRDTGERSYDRIVAVCYAPDGRDLAAAMVEGGWARDWARYSGGRYAALEDRARAAGRGMHR